MPRPKINPDNKRNKPMSVYLTQELKDAFAKKVNSDANYIAKGNLNAVVNKLIYDYVHDISSVNNTVKSDDSSLSLLSDTEMSVLQPILRDKNKRDYLFAIISDSKRLSNE